MAEYLVFIRCPVLGDWWSSDPTNWQRRQHRADRRWPPASDAGSSVFNRFLPYVFVMKDPAYLSDFYFMYLWWRIQPICQISPCTINVHICDTGSFIFVRTLDVAIYICVFVKTLLAEMCNAGSCVFFKTLWQILSCIFVISNKCKSVQMTLLKIQSPNLMSILILASNPSPQEDLFLLYLKW